MCECVRLWDRHALGLRAHGLCMAMISALGMAPSIVESIVARVPPEASEALPGMYTPVLLHDMVVEGPNIRFAVRTERYTERSLATESDLSVGKSE